MKATLTYGIIGTGGIASDFAQALQRSSRCRAVNVCGSSAEKAARFAERWALPRSAQTLHELLADPEVEAVYVATPHPLHESGALACIEAGKHVLCEKPLTIDYPSARRVVDAARARGVFLMEAFMYRCHPLVGELLARLGGGAIGPVRHVRADFGFRVPRDPEGRLFKLALGGGGILDVGGYPVSFARLIAGVAEGSPFSEPLEIQASGYLGPTGADEIACALLTFASGLTAQLTCAVRHAVGCTTVIFGEEGRIVLDDPWIPGGARQSLATGFTIFRDGQTPEQVEVRTDRATYAIEAELVADTLPALEAAWPAMSHQDTLGNMRVLDAWQAELRRRSRTAAEES